MGRNGRRIARQSLPSPDYIDGMDMVWDGPTEEKLFTFVAGPATTGPDDDDDDHISSI